MSEQPTTTTTRPDVIRIEDGGRGDRMHLLYLGMEAHGATPPAYLNATEHRAWRLLRVIDRAEGGGILISLRHAAAALDFAAAIDG
jgi:hypothetical protein